MNRTSGHRQWSIDEPSHGRLLASAHRKALVHRHTVGDAIATMVAPVEEPTGLRGDREGREAKWKPGLATGVRPHEAQHRGAAQPLVADLEMITVRRMEV